MVRALLKSQSLRAAAVLGLGGVAFTLANLILARALPAPEYGVVSLILGVVAVSSLTAPLGFDLIAGRRGWRLEASWRRTILAACALTGLGVALFGWGVYHLPPVLLICLWIITVGFGVVQATAAQFQGQRQFGTAAWILQLSNWILIPVAVAAAWRGDQTATTPCLLIAVASAIMGLGSWRLLVRAAAHGQAPAPALTMFGEALSLVTITTSSSVFLQLERLLLPPTVGIQDLALFGVLAALVGSPFRMLQASVQFTLIPSLRAAGDLRQRLRLLGKEALLVTMVVAAGSLAIWFIAPPLAHWFLAGRYDLNDALMMAALVSGVLKVSCAFALATVIALAEERELRLLSALSWSSIVISVVAAFAASPWGLVGVLYGISFGWLVRAVGAMWLALPYLRAAPAMSAQRRRHLPSPSG
jgi:MFS family permease